MKKSTENKKALPIISDGGDNSSRYNESEVKNLVRESDVPIYAIGVFEGDNACWRTPEEAGGLGLLNDVAEQTGGRHFPASPPELQDIAAKIGVDLRHRAGCLRCTPTGGPATTRRRSSRIPGAGWLKDAIIRFSRLQTHWHRPSTWPRGDIRRSWRRSRRRRLCP